MTTDPPTDDGATAGGAVSASSSAPCDEAIQEALRSAPGAPQPLDKERLAEIASRPVYLGRAASAGSFDLTPADILRRAEADGVQVSAEAHRLVARDETLRAIARAARKRAPGAGRPSKKTQYDVWAERRRDLHRRLIRLPGQATKAAEAAGEAHSAEAAPLHALIAVVGRRLAAECGTMAELAREVRKAPELGHKAAKRGPAATPAALNPFVGLISGGLAVQLEAVGLAPRLSVAQIQRILVDAGVRPGRGNLRPMGSAREKKTS